MGDKVAATLDSLLLMDIDDLIDFVFVENFWNATCSNAGNTTWTGRSSKNDRAYSINGEYLQAWERPAQATCQPHNSASRAHCNDNTVDGFVEVCNDLSCCMVKVCLPVELIAILVDPMAMRNNFL